MSKGTCKIYETASMKGTETGIKFRIDTYANELGFRTMEKKMEFYTLSTSLSQHERIKSHIADAWKALIELNRCIRCHISCENDKNPIKMHQPYCYRCKSMFFYKDTDGENRKLQRIGGVNNENEHSTASAAVAKNPVAESNKKAKLVVVEYTDELESLIKTFNANSVYGPKSGISVLVRAQRAVDLNVRGDTDVSRLVELLSKEENIHRNIIYKLGE